MTDPATLITEAIIRNAGLVLSLPSAGMLRHCKSRFLGEEDDGSFWVEASPAEGLLIAELIRTKQPCGISFKNGINKVIFAAPVVEHNPQMRLNAATVLPAIRVSRPKEIKAVQRRQNYRVSVTGDSAVSLRVWRIAEHAHLSDRPMAAQEIPASLRDLSTGGIGAVMTGAEGHPPRVSTEDRLRILVETEGISLLMEGRMRYPIERPNSSTIRAGIQFRELGTDLEGRRMLATITRIVGELQRSEIRRYRLGITSVA